MISRQYYWKKLFQSQRFYGAVDIFQNLIDSIDVFGVWVFVAFPEKIIRIGHVNRVELGEKIRLLVQTGDLHCIDSQTRASCAGGDFRAYLY